MKTFSKKKGFTIVELVIVIAVIGVLTAVLVPTFVNLVNKANNASDESLVKNLNTQLRMKEQTEGKNQTLDAALDDAAEAGYLVENLTPKGNRDIVWNQEKDEFGFGDEATGDLYKYWKIYEKASDIPAVQTYSIYAKGTKGTEAPVVSVGFDAGKNTKLDTVSFANDTDSTKEVKIRTNGGKLNIGSEGHIAKGRVHHYGTLDDATVFTEKNSFHTHGVVQYLDLQAGKVVAESNGVIYLMKAESDTTAAEENGGVIIIPATATSDDIKTDDLPEGYEVTETGTTQPSNIADKIAENQGLLGAGTARDPFQVYDYQTMQAINMMYDSGYHYFAVNKSLTDDGNIDCTNWTPISLNGSFDGKGVNLLNVDARLFMNVGAMGRNGVLSSWSTQDVTVKDMDVYFNLEGDLDAAGGMAKQILGNNTTYLENIKIHGQIVSGSNSGALFSYTTGNPYDTNQHVNQKIEVNDCLIDATLVSTSNSVAVVSGYPNYCNPELVLKINNPGTIWAGKASNPAGSIKFVTMSAWSIPEGGTPNQTFTCNKLNTVSLTKDGDGNFMVAKSANATTAKAYISAQLTETDADGNQTAVAGITMAVQYLGQFNLGESTKVLDAFSEFEFHNKQEATSAELSGNKLTVNIAGPNNYTFGTIKLVVVESDANANIVSYQVKELVSAAKGASWIIK